MGITYVINSNLYVNLTNHCTNRCEFCVREAADTGLFADFRLEREPTFEEIAAEMDSRNLNMFSEIVFCGYGEPACRLYDMLSTCRKIRETSGTPIRVNTNGHASLIMKEDTAPMFRGLVDCMRISLNAPDPDTYMKLCHPKFGEDTFSGVLKFAREVVKYVPKVVLTAMRGTLTDEAMDRCAKIASDIGAGFHIRNGIIE